MARISSDLFSFLICKFPYILLKDNGMLSFLLSEYFFQTHPKYIGSQPTFLCKPQCGVEETDSRFTTCIYAKVNATGYCQNLNSYSRFLFPERYPLRYPEHPKIKQYTHRQGQVDSTNYDARIIHFALKHRRIDLIAESLTFPGIQFTCKFIFPIFTLCAFRSSLVSRFIKSAFNQMDMRIRASSHQSMCRVNTETKQKETRKSNVTTDSKNKIKYVSRACATPLELGHLEKQLCWCLVIGAMVMT